MGSYETAAKSVSPFLGGINELLWLFLSLLGKSREAKKRPSLKVLANRGCCHEEDGFSSRERSCTRFSLSFYGILPIIGIIDVALFHR